MSPQKSPLWKTGYIHLYLGTGKGKTTAAVGLAVRVLGAGGKVLFLQFLKDGQSAECRVLKNIPGLKYQACGRPGRIIRPSLADHQAAEQGWSAFTTGLASGRYDLVVADELGVAIELGLVPEDQVLQALRHKPRQVEVVVTGHVAGPKLRAAADLITEMRAKKHYYEKGIQARPGIEF